MYLIRLLLLVTLPLIGMADDEKPSLTFLEFLGMTTELEKIGVEADSTDTSTPERQKDTSEEKPDKTSRFQLSPLNRPIS